MYPTDRWNEAGLPERHRRRRRARIHTDSQEVIHLCSLSELAKNANVDRRSSLVQCEARELTTPEGVSIDNMVNLIEYADPQNTVRTTNGDPGGGGWDS